MLRKLWAMSNTFIIINRHEESGFGRMCLHLKVSIFHWSLEIVSNDRMAFELCIRIKWHSFSSLSHTHCGSCIVRTTQSGFVGGIQLKINANDARHQHRRTILPKICYILWWNCDDSWAPYEERPRRDVKINNNNKRLFYVFIIVVRKREWLSSCVVVR